MTDDAVRQEGGDSRSRAANARFRDLSDRNEAVAPEYAYAPRWVPTGNWRMSPGDALLFALASPSSSAPSRCTCWATAGALRNAPHLP